MAKLQATSSYFVDPLQQKTSPLSSHEDSVSFGIDVLKHTDNSPEDNLQMLTSEKSASDASSKYSFCTQVEKVFGASQFYMKEWETICKCKDINECRSWAFNGELSVCRFRSVCWRVYLNIFPTDSSKWLSIVRSKRESYEITRHELMVTPGSADETLDPNVNNPLSQDEESPWNQYFEDSELKSLIRLDVQRTFPEVEFFQSKRIEEMMVSILFCYARKYPDVSYVQGMHEILAPLAFVLNYDHHVHAHSTKDGPTSNLLQEIMDEAYLEHDSFVLFETVMEKLHNWYEDGEPKAYHSPRSKLIPTQPFARPQDVGPTTKIVQRLTKIHDILLKKHDSEVFAHLNRLEIPPQVYGIRWARLMFGREFPFTDLLTVWDTIFADSYSDFLLLEYLMVAMLANIRDRLLVADYITSLNLLMRYPPYSDVHSIIQMAFYFRNPKSHNHPVKCVSFIPNQTVGGQPNIHRAPQAVLQSLQGPVTRSTSLPRPPSTPSDHAPYKQRSSSVDQNCRPDIDESSRKTSPTAHTTDTMSGVSYSAASRSSPEEETKTSDRATARVVSGLVRLGERLGRPRDSESLQQDKILNERPMDELKFMERSAPIPTIRLPGTLPQENHNNSFTSSSEGEEDPTFPARSVSASQRVSVEDVLAVSLGCALKLSHHQASLATRLSQLQIQSDFTIRAAMEGIGEVVETLKELKSKPRRNSGNKKPSSTIHAKSLPITHSAFSHPLMDSEISDS